MRTGINALSKISATRVNLKTSERDLVVEGFGAGFGRRFHRAVDLFLRGLEQLLTFFRKRFAFFKERDRFIELDVAAFEVFDDRLEARDLGFEGGLFFFSHLPPSVRRALRAFRAATAR